MSKAYLAIKKDGCDIASEYESTWIYGFEIHPNGCKQDIGVLIRI